jgi:hypothetical protein
MIKGSGYRFSGTGLICSKIVMPDNKKMVKLKG